MRMRYCGSERRDAFTLVELLVVITIIAMLAGIIAPSIQQGVALANSTRCKSNISEVLKANGLYSAKMRGFKPPLLWDKGGSSESGWASPNVKMEGQPIGQGILVKDGFLTFNLLLCPIASISKDGAIDEAAWRDNAQAGSSYSYFWRHSSTVKSPEHMKSGWKYSGSSDAGRPGLIMDINADSGHPYEGAYKGSAWESHPLLGIVNVGYIGGSVESVSNKVVKLESLFDETAELRWWDQAHKEY